MGPRLFFNWPFLISFVTAWVRIPIGSQFSRMITFISIRAKRSTWTSDPESKSGSASPSIAMISLHRRRSNS